MKSVSILGATGSIGQSALDVVRRHPDRFRVHLLSAHRQVDVLVERALTCHPEVLAVADPDAGPSLREQAARAGLSARIAVGPDELVDVAGTPGVDTVVAAIVGAAGLAPTLAAAQAARTLLLANKEAIVMAGGLFMDVCARSGVRLLPIDSEHNALFQCMPAEDPSGRDAVETARKVVRLILTASGGPFRTTPVAQLVEVTPDQACAHPRWVMGRKISVDSATMMNKGLELIEAQVLFNIDPQRLSVLIHPQSIVHSMVEYVDGTLLAQMGSTDMRIPIAHALGYPDRLASGADRLDLAAIGRLEFEEPDWERFPCLRLAHEVLGYGGGMPCVLNAANEISVESFLAGRCRFTDIASFNRAIVDAMADTPAPTRLDAVMDLDAEVRRRTRALAEGNP